MSNILRKQLSTNYRPNTCCAIIWLYYENATHQLKNVPKTQKNYFIETHKNIVRKRIGLHKVNENVTDSPASPVV